MKKARQNSSIDKEFHGFKVKQEELYAVITMLGMTKPSKMGELDSVLEQLVKNNCYHLILDLSETRLIHSYEIGAIVRHLQNIQGKNGRLAFVNPSDRVRYLLVTTCIDELAPIYDDMETALQYILTKSA